MSSVSEDISRWLLILAGLFIIYHVSACDKARDYKLKRAALNSRSSTLALPRELLSAAMSLWVDKYRPTSLSKLDYHKEQASRLKKLVYIFLNCILSTVYKPIHVSAYVSGTEQ